MSIFSRPRTPGQEARRQRGKAASRRFGERLVSLPEKGKIAKKAAWEEYNRLGLAEGEFSFAKYYKWYEGEVDKEYKSMLGLTSPSPVATTRILSEQAQASGQAERRRLLRGRRGKAGTIFTTPGFMAPVPIKRRALLKKRFG